MKKYRSNLLTMQKNTRMRINIFAILFLLLSSTTFGQNPSELKITHKLSILNSRAFFQFPDSAKNIARSVGIMSADPNANKETRIMFDIGKQRLVFFARELYETCNGDLLAAINKDNSGDETIKILTNKDSLLSVLITPKQPDTSGEAILINNLFVRMPDNSLFVIGAYINLDAYKNKNDFQVLTEKVFSTLTKGPRNLNLRARTETIPIFGTKKNFTVPLPQGFVVTRDAKYDFQVLNFKKVKDISDTNWLSLTIYTGNHPSYFYPEYDFDESRAEKAGGNFLNKNVEWLRFTDPGKPLHLKEQQIPSDQIENGLIIHIAMLGNSQAAIDELSRLIEKIKVTQ